MKRTGEYRDCLMCGNNFYAKKKKILIGDGKYCSKECFYAHRKSNCTIIIKCGVCDKEKKTLKSRPDKYCSRECFLISMTNSSKNPWFGADHSGHKSPTWKGGITPLHLMIRNCQEFHDWRYAVLKRDNFICQDCGKVHKRAHAHHKNEFSKIFAEFLKEYSQFSPIEDKETLFRLALSYKPFWDINNGECLCPMCHRKTFVGIRKVKSLI